MGQVTTHTEGRVVTHHVDDGVAVTQLPQRDGATAAAGETPAPAPKPATPRAPATTPAKATPAVKAAVKQQRARVAKGPKGPKAKK